MPRSVYLTYVALSVILPLAIGFRALPGHQPQIFGWTCSCPFHEMWMLGEYSNEESLWLALGAWLHILILTVSSTSSGWPSTRFVCNRLSSCIKLEGPLGCSLLLLCAVFLGHNSKCRLFRLRGLNYPITGCGCNPPANNIRLTLLIVPCGGSPLGLPAGHLSDKIIEPLVRIAGCLQS